MLKSDILNQVGKIYSQGGNIIQFINQLEKNENNTKEGILISYDYQAGSYLSNYKDKTERFHKYSGQLVNEMKRLGKFNSILEAGIGEATTFKNVTQNMDMPYDKCYGFDISWSRLKVAKGFLSEDTPGTQHIFVADLSNIPLCDNAIDLVYTAHSVEPNGGNEKQILQELYRVTKNFLVLFEPDSELAGSEARKRMEIHGYVKNLVGVAKSLGYNVIKNELLQYSLNALNPTSVIVIEKEQNAGDGEPHFCCPITKTKLNDCGDVFFSPQSRLMFPVIQGIPCLLDSQAILGCKYGEI